MSINKIYLDNASTTSIYEEVIQEMNNVMRSNYGNPSSTHSIGLEAKSSIENARKNIAQKLGVLPQEIIFTSCGTESNNLIIRSCVNHLNVKRIISTTLEHKCVLETCLEMKKLNSDVEVIFLKVNSLGEIDLNELETILSSDDKKTLATVYEFCEESVSFVQNPTFKNARDVLLDCGKMNNEIGENTQDLQLNFAISKALNSQDAGVAFVYLLHSNF